MEGDALVFDPKTKRYSGRGLKRDRGGFISTGISSYSNLRKLYGDTTYAVGGEDSKRLTGSEYREARDAWVQKTGGSPEMFRQHWAESEGETGLKFVESQLAQAERVRLDMEEFRQGQTDAFAGLDETGRRDASHKLEQALRANPELRRSLTGSGRGSHQAKKALGELFGTNRSERGEFTPERFQSVLKGLERAGVNPRDYLGFLKPAATFNGFDVNSPSTPMQLTEEEQRVRKANAKLEKARNAEQARVKQVLQESRERARKR